MTEQNKPEGFDPRTLPGAEIVFDETDENGEGLAVVAVPLSALTEAGAQSDELAGALDALGAGNPMDAVLNQFRMMGWAEDENRKACERHGENPEDKGPIFTAFPLCSCVEQPYMELEPIFRAHCREIYDRVAKGHDVKPGTDAEILGILVEASLIQPFCGGLTCLYFRLVSRILPELFEQFKADKDPAALDLEAYEKVNGQDADQHEGELRRMLTRERAH